jgi:hypothetical protein
VCRSLQDAAKSLCVRDVMVGGDHDHDRVWFLVVDVLRGQTNRWSSAPACGLNDDVAQGQIRKLRLYRRHMVRAYADQDSVRRNRRQEPAVCVLQHG